MTTFLGLLPLLLEKSMQAKFMIPMAISLGFGVVFSTFISLVLVPAGYMIMEDVKGGSSRLPGFLKRVYGLESSSVGETIETPGGTIQTSGEKEPVSVDARGA
jgi:hypothetical protein